MASWHSLPLEVTYEVLGWVAFFSWSISFYPQVILNFTRKSVVGLNFDFLVLNLTKHSSYLIYNAALYFSPVIQRQYHEEYGYDEMIPVAANDVAFSIHAVLLTAITLFQVFIYERGNQKVSKTCMAITSAVWGFAVVCVIIAWRGHSWLWLISVFNSIQVFMTAIKYIPQPVGLDADNYKVSRRNHVYRVVDSARETPRLLAEVELQGATTGAGVIGFSLVESACQASSLMLLIALFNAADCLILGMLVTSQIFY